MGYWLLMGYWWDDNGNINLVAYMFDEMLGSFGGILKDLEDTNPLGIFEGMNHWG